MTILDKIINVVKENGAITLQGIYDELPELKKTVIRGTLNRYIRKQEKEIDRATRGIYISIYKKDNTNVLDFKCSSKRKRKDIITKFKSLIEKNNKQIIYKHNMVVGMEGQLSFEDMIDNIGVVEDDISINLSEITQNNLSLSSDKDDSSNSHTFKSISSNYNSDSIDLDMNKEYPIEYFDNKIFKEDSRDFLKKIPNESIDLVVTDPPYRTTPRGIGKRTSTGGMMRSELTCKGKIFKNNCINIKEYIHEFFRVLKDGTHCYIMTNHKNLVEILNESINAGFKFISSLIWKKNNKGPGPNYYMPQFEYILFFKKGKLRRINNCGTSDVLEFDNKKIRVPELDEKGNPVLTNKGRVKYRNLHDTEKPVSLMKVLIENSSNVSERILDPFCGIGSVAMACKELSRKFICNEIDETYRDIAKARVDETVPLY